MTKEKKTGKENDVAIASAYRRILKLEQQLSIEKDAKNYAYAFIFSQKMLEEFLQFRRQHDGKDPFELCFSFPND